MSEWIKVRNGVSRKPLARDEARNLQMDIIKLEPGFDDMPHWHDDYEWVYVLEGTIEDEKGIHKAGDFLINDPVNVHKPKSKDGCKLICVWCGSVRDKP
jgi:anti-sigma factor ChrR (cupin superfamily)